MRKLLIYLALVIVIITYTGAVIMGTVYFMVANQPLEPGGQTIVVVATPTPWPTLPVKVSTPTLAPTATPTPEPTRPVPNGTPRRAGAGIDPWQRFYERCATYQTLGLWEKFDDVHPERPCPPDAISRAYGPGMPQLLLENCASAQVVGRHFDLYCPEDAIDLAYPDGMPEQLLELCEWSRDQDIDVKRFCP